MTVDLKSMNRKELEKLKSQVEKALEKVSQKEMKAAREAAEKAAAAHGFSLDEIASAATPARRGRKPSGAAKTKSPAKYRNPANADQTWTGKGRQPEWFKAEVAKGTDPSKMEI